MSLNEPVFSEFSSGIRAQAVRLGAGTLNRLPRCELACPTTLTRP